MRNHGWHHKTFDGEWDLNGEYWCMGFLKEKWDFQWRFSEKGLSKLGDLVDDDLWISMASLDPQTQRKQDQNDDPQNLAENL